MRKITQNTVEHEGKIYRVFHTSGGCHECDILKQCDMANAKKCIMEFGIDVAMVESKQTRLHDSKNKTSK